MTLATYRGPAASFHILGFFAIIGSGLLAILAATERWGDPVERGAGVVLVVMGLFAFVAAAFLYVLETEPGAVLACVVGFGFLVFGVPLAASLSLGSGLILMAARRARGFLF